MREHEKPFSGKDSELEVPKALLPHLPHRDCEGADSDGGEQVRFPRGPGKEGVLGRGRQEGGPAGTQGRGAGAGREGQGRVTEAPTGGVRRPLESGGSGSHCRSCSRDWWRLRQ